MCKNPVISKEMAAAIYDILVEECGANTKSKGSFVYEFSTDCEFGPTSEWRFQGSLGYGGKFRYPAMTVDCYSEDETPARLVAIDRANTKLLQFQNQKPIIACI